MVYPTIPAGGRVTAALLTSMLPLTAAKTGTTARASTTTATADPELQVSVEANAEYKFSAYIRYSGDTAGDLKCTFTGPSGSSGSWGARTMDTAATTSTGNSQAVRTPLGTVKSIGCISTSVPQTFNVEGRLITGASAGTFSFDWAQDTSNATGTGIEADSCFILHRIA
ncbi:hypothetical protein [Streptomyces sp. NPDC127084]|uniref:hypothetical protein n=1 Tax=Streptomyces sp. NPDC127084 TaxID=3347133 RepID=UPI00366112BD